MTKRNQTYYWWFFTEHEGLMVQTKGKPKAVAHQVAVDMLIEQGYSANKSNVKLVPNKQ